MKIREIIDSIRKRDLVLPEFQREYVWSRELAKQLMVSLIRGYPVGSLLYWKTDNPPELKNIDDLPERIGTINIILDGQQRLTTLYLLIMGEIPPYYKPEDIKTDPRNLYYNLENGEFQYFQPSRMKDNPLWQMLPGCYNNKDINVFELAKANSSTDSESFDLANIYNSNLNTIRNIQNIDLPVQTVPSEARIDDAIDVFDRVNSKGTKLTDAELALTHITGKWPQARRVMKSKINELENRFYYFDLSLLTRALTGVVEQRALFHTIHASPREKLENGWSKLSKILDYLINVLPHKGFIHSTYDLNTVNVFIPIIVYLSHKDGKFSNEKEINSAIHWLYAAHVWARYTAQTDQRLEHDVSLVIRKENPWSDLLDQIIDQRGRIIVKPDDLEGRGVQHPLYRMMYILAKAHGAVDWFNGTSLGITHGGAYIIHNHHIFPQSILYKNGYEPDNHLHRKIINEIANRAILTAETNIDISNKTPDQYLPAIEKNYPGALSKQFIPINPELWKIENFSEFLEARRKLISKKINEFMDALISEQQDVLDRPIKEIIELGESATLEFKSTLQWDIIQNRVNKELRYSSLKTIVAFLNDQGGTLIIGVEDSGQEIGLDNDLKNLNDSLDHFEQLMSGLIKECVGPQFSPYIKMRPETVDELSIFVVDVEKAPEPSFLKMINKKEFFIRIGNTSQPLDAEETNRYIQTNWE
jgi:hypothetical protein